MTWSASMAIVVLSVTAFAFFNASGNLFLGAAAGILLTTAISLHYGGLVQFRDGRLPVRTVIVLSAIWALPLATAFALGFDGLGFWLVNGFSAALVFYCGVGYWRMRSESRASITIIACLHHFLAATFVLCIIVGIQEAPLYLVNGSPQNWAEVLNLVASVIALTGIGGLLITVHQERISRRHQHNALTDALTGLRNRRALFEFYEGEVVPQNTGIIVLDLDEFKVLNDTYGHAVGDMVLRNFAGLLEGLVEPRDMAIRLGGEEFVLILPDRSTMEALALAELVRASAARMVHDANGKQITCTVSAGVSFAEKAGKSLDTLLRKADNALYLSKRNGRNRVTAPDSQAA
ncbi:GGDEF domain-containing protein [Pelagibacterium limicola]|uniref:GGDEF domain-containing protein n=1 Tax=Pelagibacterium limicola TaxID=2791022 RepID=UPI0018AFEF84|nr:diguanylate cyclase [Pelagibacterium limicola]